MNSLKREKRTDHQSVCCSRVQIHNIDISLKAITSKEVLSVQLINYKEKWFYNIEETQRHALTTQATGNKENLMLAEEINLSEAVSSSERLNIVETK